MGREIIQIWWAFILATLEYYQNLQRSSPAASWLHGYGVVFAFLASFNKRGALL